jgi:hypothetical protein
MLSFLFWFSLGFVVWVVVASFFEWLLHRYVMHRPLGKFTYPFKAHAIVHHQTFRADHSYHLHDEADRETIPMAWWNGPALIALAMLPVLPLVWAVGHWGVAAGALLAMSAYYGTYEYIHWCMHLPKQRSIERSGAFFRLNGHHLLHHRYMHKNFNVVLPLADYCLGTLLLRSKVKFAQPVGPFMPDVQPHEIATGRAESETHAATSRSTAVTSDTSPAASQFSAISGDAKELISPLP